MKMLFYKYPRTPFTGQFIKGFAEIEKDQVPYDINFVVTFSMYASAEAKKVYGKDIESYQQHLDDNYFNCRAMARRVRNLLSNEGYRVDPYLGFAFAYNHTGPRGLRHFQKLYDPITANFRISVTRELQKTLQDPKSCSNFIGEMLIKLDNMMGDIQRETGGQLMFVPRHLAKIDKEKKASTMDLLAAEIAETEDISVG